MIRAISDAEEMKKRAELGHITNNVKTNTMIRSRRRRW
jgi:hypothetical protein